MITTSGLSEGPLPALRKHAFVATLPMVRRMVASYNRDTAFAHFAPLRSYD